MPGVTTKYGIPYSLGSDAISTADDTSHAVALAVIAALDALIPAGSLISTARTTAPTGWLLCDGSSLLRASYPDLFTAIGTSYGSVDGTHFNVPDCRGRVPVGAGTGPGLTARAFAAKFGEEDHQLTVAEIPPLDTFASGSASQAYVERAILAAPSFDNTAFVTGATNATAVTQKTSGGAGSHNTMQPSLVVNWIIRA
jgi:microcystin-dependent protein